MHTSCKATPPGLLPCINCAVPSSLAGEGLCSQGSRAASALDLGDPQADSVQGDLLRSQISVVFLPPVESELLSVEARKVFWSF